MSSSLVKYRFLDKRQEAHRFAAISAPSVSRFAVQLQVEQLVVRANRFRTQCSSPIDCLFHP